MRSKSFAVYLRVAYANRMGGEAARCRCRAFRLQEGYADQNRSLLCRPALSLLKNEKTAKVGVKNKRLIAAWDDDYLEKVVFGV